MSPQRIQRKRTKGWLMPEGAVYVGRPTRYGNPFRSSRFGSVAEAEYGSDPAAVEGFRDWIASVDIDFSELRGRDLACWCPLDQPCHADVLLELANR